jgi:hypothetical protein
VSRCPFTGFKSLAKRTLTLGFEYAAQVTLIHPSHAGGIVSATVADYPFSKTHHYLKDYTPFLTLFYPRVSLIQVEFFLEQRLQVQV